jgi:lysophospholipase L1-like esterase
MFSWWFRFIYTPGDERLLDSRNMLGTADDTIYLFGDSITQHGYDPAVCGWVSLLSHAYQRRMMVVNGGLSGYSSDQALAILPRMLPTPEQAKIRILVIFFGANDARKPDTGESDSPNQHVPQDKYKKNLRGIATHDLVKAHGEDLKIVLVTPPPINESQLTRKNREARIANEYAAQVRVLARELRDEGLNVRCFDIWNIFMKKCGWAVGEPLIGAKDVEQDPKTGLATLLSDGLHLAIGGNKLLFQSLLKLITKEWPHLHPEAITFPLPTWMDKKEWKEVFKKRLEDEQAEGPVGDEHRSWTLTSGTRHT